MKTLKLSLCLLAALLAPRFASAFLVGPYAADTNTLFLLHFDETAGGSVTTNIGIKGGNFYTVTNTTTGIGVAEPPPVTTLLGYASYTNSNGANFGKALTGTNTDGISDGMAGYDGNKNGTYDADTGDGSGNGVASPDAIALTNLNIGLGGSSPFTLEALICPSIINSNQEIICSDNSHGTRGFQFKITSTGQLQFNLIPIGGGSASFAIPTTGTHKFVAGSWYHVAAVYSGTAVTLYWTQLDPSNTVANAIGSLNVAYSSSSPATPLVIGGENRGAQGESFKGLVDEVRISKVARAANGMQFFSPTVTVSPNPVSQKIDDNRPVTFTVGGSSLTALGYQWRFNGTPIPGATVFGTNTSSYSIASVNLTNAGSYDCVVTNTSGNSATSSPAILVVGAGNFLSHRYSFTVDTSDSIGGANGTNFGDATVSGGALMLDGSGGTDMQLPGGLLQGVQAATFDFWATCGTSGNNEDVFDFGNTNGTIQGVGGHPNNYLYFSPHSGTVNRLTGTPGTEEFEQTASATGILDGKTVHVTCVVDSPDNYLAIYTNGVLEVANTNYTIPFASFSDQLAIIGSSLTNDAYLNASIDELRIYNGALSPASIAQSDLQGPNVVLNDGPVQLLGQPVNTSSAQGLTATFSGSATGHQPFTYQWFENGSLIPGATNATYSFVVSASQNGHIFQFAVTNNVTGTNYFAVSTNATLTVVNPPALVWADWINDTWDTSTPNWDDLAQDSSQLTYGSLDKVIFNGYDAPNDSGSGTVDLAQSVNPLSVTVDSATENYTFTSSGQNGSLTGGGSLAKNNNNTLIIDVPDNMTGSTTVSGGVLQVGNNDSNGTLGSGAVTNNATLSLDRADTALVVTNTIHGTGTLSIDGSGSVTVSGASDFTGPTLVNQGILNLQSSTGLGATNGSVTVNAANSAELYITANVDIATKPLSIGGTGQSNAGALRKGGAGVTTYYGPVSLTTDTTLSVDGGATLNLTNSSGIDGVTIPGNSSLSLNGGGTGNIFGPFNLGSGSLNVGGGTWTVAPSNNLSGVTTINGGQLKITGPLSFGPVPASFNSSQVTLNGGTLGAATNVILADSNIGITLNANSTLSADTNATLTISNQISSSSGAVALTKTGAGKVVLNGPNPFNGILDVDTGQPTTGNDGTLVIASSAAIANIPAISGAPFINIRNQNAATSTLGLDGTSGSITVAPDINLNGRNNAVPAIDNIAGNNTISGNIAINTGGGIYELESDAGTLTLTAPLPYSTPATSPRTFTFAGVGGIIASNGIQNGTSAIAINVIKTGSGTLSLPAANTYSGFTTISNGMLLLNGSITSTGSVLVASGAAATLSGTGSIADNVTVQSGGNISPGTGTNSIGALTISGNLTNSGTLLMDLSKSGSVLTNDTIVGIGTFQSGGTLQLVLNGSPLSAGNSFTLFNAASYTGAFTNIVPATPGAGLIWNTNALATSGVLGVGAGTAPLTGLKFTSPPVISGTSLIISATNSGAGTIYLLTSTNVALPLSTWTPIWTNIVGGSGSFTTNLPNIVNPALGRQFYILGNTN